MRALGPDWEAKEMVPVATVFTDAAGYTHTLHTVLRDQVEVHTVWTSDADGWYLGARQLVSYPNGHELVPAGAWVFCSDYSPTPTRLVDAAYGRRLLSAWAGAAARGRAGRIASANTTDTSGIAA